MKAGCKQVTGHNAVDMAEFMQIVDLPFWAKIEEEFEGKNI